MTSASTVVVDDPNEQRHLRVSLRPVIKLVDGVSAVATATMSPDVTLPSLPTGRWGRDGSSIRRRDETLVVAVAARAEDRLALALWIERLPALINENTALKKENQELRSRLVGLRYPIIPAVDTPVTQ